MINIKESDLPSQDGYRGIVSVDIIGEKLIKLAEKCNVDTNKYFPIGLDLVFKTVMEVSTNIEFICKDTQSNNKLVSIEAECKKEDLYEVIHTFHMRFTTNGKIPTDEELVKIPKD